MPCHLAHALPCIALSLSCSCCRSAAACLTGLSPGPWYKLWIYAPIGIDLCFEAPLFACFPLVLPLRSLSLSSSALYKSRFILHFASSFLVSLCVLCSRSVHVHMHPVPTTDAPPAVLAGRAASLFAALLLPAAASAAAACWSSVCRVFFSV